jgi:DNA polymerase-1
MRVVCVDTEGDGKTPPTLRLVQIAIDDGQVNVYEPDAPEIAQALGAADVIVAHNGPDDLWLLAQRFPRPGVAYDHMVGILFDTMVAARHAGAPAGVGLAAAGAHFLLRPRKAAAFAELKKQRGPDGEVLSWTGADPTGWAKVPVDAAAYRDYAAADVHDTRALYAQFKPLAADRFYRADIDLHVLCAAMTRRGIAVAPERVVELRKRAVAGKESAAVVCSRYGVANPGSSQQVVAALGPEVTLGLPRTDKGAVSASEKALESIVDQSPLARAVLDYRHHAKLLNTYYDAYLRGVDRVHPRYNVVGAVSGRMSAAGPNIQQLPASVRGCFRADPGHVFVAADYSAIELKVAAVVSGDRQLLADIAAGDDIPALVSAQAGVPRGKAKRIIYGRFYGGGLATLAAQSGASRDAVRAVMAVLDRRYPKVRSLDQRLRDYVSRGGLSVETLAGRTVVVDAAAPHAALNRIIQGTAADLFKAALLRVAATFGDGAVWLALHDEIGIMVPENWAGEAAQLLSDTMFSRLEFKGRGLGIAAVPTILGTHWGGIT